MHQPVLWEPDTIVHAIHGIRPQLASWYKSTHPSQLRLQAYRQPIVDELLPLLPQIDTLFLHLDVSVQKPEHVLKHHDLENYLTPLFGARLLDASRFVLVTARKFLGGSSTLQVGTARPASTESLTAGWNHFTYTSHEAVGSKQWKANLRNAISATNPPPLTSPAVEVQIAWTCSPRRTWLNLWKPTGDCMGPILGEQNPQRPFSPDDDRIVDLKFHRLLDEALAYDVGIQMWWRARQAH